MGRTIKTTISQAVDYWSRYVDECDLSVDWAEADTHCWRCGCERHLERCHIVPDSLGGADAPENIVLLCKRCHAEGPNVTDPDIMWDWIKAYNVPFYETFWLIRGAKEYEFIYRKKLSQEIADILAQSGKCSADDEMEGLMSQFVASISERASKHFGQPYFNTVTMAGLYRMMLKSLAEAYGVTFPIPSEKSTHKPWYVDYIF